MLNKKLSPGEIKSIIELLRNEMILTGLKEGLCSERTINISQKLDQYITNYQTQKSNQA